MIALLRSLLAALVCLFAPPALAAFADHGDGTVTDTVTGLMWDRCSWGQSNTSTCAGGAASTHTWAAALGVAVSANTGSHRGYSDWRLPNKNELESLADLTTSAPAVNTTAFPATVSNLYWTSTTYAPDPAAAWLVAFGYGDTGADYKSGIRYVRLVRSGQSFAAFDSMAPDTTPDAFAFVTQTNVPRIFAATSETITVTGITGAAAISITGSASSEYQINGGSWTATAGSVSSGNTVAVRHGTSADYATMVTSTLTIGGVSGSFSSVTELAPGDTTPNAFSFTGQAPVELSTVMTSNSITVAGIDTVSPISVVNGEYRINSGTWTTAAGSVTNGQTVTVRHTSSALEGTVTHTVLTIGGVSGTFVSGTRDQTPDALFTLGTKNPAVRGAPVISASPAISGINVPSPVSVSGAAGSEYRINGGPWTSAAGYVSTGDTVAVRHVAANSDGASTTTTLTIGGVSSTFTSTTPLPSTADTDGDGLPDAWEVAGVVGGVSLNEADGIPADPNKKDIYVWIDVLPSTKSERRKEVPGGTAIFLGFKDDYPLITGEQVKKVVGAFQNRGLNLHVKLNYVSRDALDNAGLPNSVRYGEILAGLKVYKGAFGFYSGAGATPDLRDKIYRYVLFGDVFCQDSVALPCEEGKRISASGVARNEHNAIFLAGRSNTTDQQRAATLMHELGHALGLGHGGPWYSFTGNVPIIQSEVVPGSNQNYKPNYLSIMNYLYSDGLPTTVPVTENNPAGVQLLLDYASVKYADINETAPQFDLTVGKANMNQTAPYGPVMPVGIDNFVYRPRQGCGYLADGVHGWIPAKEHEFTGFGDYKATMELVGSGVRASCDNLALTNGRVDLNSDFKFNLDSQSGVLRSFTDWDHLVYTATGVGGGFGDVAGLPASDFSAIHEHQKTLDEPSPELTHRAEDYESLLVAALSERETLPGVPVVHQFRLTNQGRLADTYDLVVTAASGWDTTPSVPMAITLQAGESKDFIATTAIPGGAAIGSDSHIGLVFSSRASARTASATIWIRVKAGASVDTGVDTDGDGVLDAYDSNPSQPAVLTVNPFAFATVSGTTLDTRIVSSSITVAGPTEAVAISVDGGQYSINGGPFTRLSGNITAGQTVRVAVTSSSRFATASVATLSIGTQKSSFTVTTEAAAPVISAPVAPTIPADSAAFELSGGSAILTAGGAHLTLGSRFTSTAITLPNGDTVTVSGSNAVLQVAKVIVNGREQYVLSVVGGSVSFAGSTPGQVIGMVAGKLIIAGSGGAAVTVSEGSGNGRNIHVNGGSITLTTARTVSSANRVFASAANPAGAGAIYGGESVALDANGQLTSAWIGTAQRDQQRLGDALMTPSIPWLTATDGSPILVLTSERLGRSPESDLLTKLATLGWYPLGQRGSFGEYLLSQGNTTYAAHPVGKLAVDPFLTTPDGVTFPGNGDVAFTRDAVTITLAPSVTDIAAFAQQVRLQEGTVTVLADGAYLLELGGRRLAMQAGFEVTTTGEAAGFRQNAAGHYEFTDRGGRRQVLYPVAADYATLAAEAKKVDAAALVRGNGDGTVTMRFPGVSLTLRPRYELIATPAARVNDMWWIDAGEVLYIKVTNPAGYVQGFDLR